MKVVTRRCSDLQWQSTSHVSTKTSSRVIQRITYHQRRRPLLFNASRTTKDANRCYSTNHVPPKTRTTVIQQITYHQRRKPLLLNESRTTKDANHCYLMYHVPPKTQTTAIRRITYHQRRKPLLLNESRANHYYPKNHEASKIQNILIQPITDHQDINHYNNNTNNKR